ncbi:hypothetical protein RUM43_010856 [Polyplax serrata]|uniref:Uncharacterized protein n=1 Tax=Polyplax serrata TaxID=468196 RepID=A0AAN8NRZ4_POLSC
MDHLVVGLPVARHEYLEKHNRICRYLHCHKCREFGAKGVSKQWYDHTPDPVTTVDSIQYFTTTKLCVVIKNKIRKWCKLMGTSPARKTYFEVAREKIEAQCPGNRIWQCMRCEITEYMRYKIYSSLERFMYPETIRNTDNDEHIRRARYLETSRSGTCQRKDSLITLHISNELRTKKNTFQPLPTIALALALGLCEQGVKKTCNSCKCPRESHDVYHKEWVNVRNRLGFDSPMDMAKSTSKDKSFNEGYAWVPSGLPSYKISEYFQQIPSSKVPRLGSSGEKYRDKQLILQLPKQDLALAYCKHVENSQQSCYEDFINARNEIALDIGYVKDNISISTECPTCHHFIKPGDLGVIAPKFGEDVVWHPGCFVCTECNEILVDLTYCVHDNLLYCERHYAEQLKPRCAGCDEGSVKITLKH